MAKCFLQVLTEPLARRHQCCSHRKAMAEQSEKAASVPIPPHDLTPHSQKATRSDAKQMLSTWKRQGCFHWPLQSACQVGGEEVGGEKEKEPSRAHSSTPSWQKNCNCSVCLLTRIPKASSCLGLYILIMSEKKKKVKKKDWDLLLLLLFSSLPHRMSSKNYDLLLRKVMALLIWPEEILLFANNHTYQVFWTYPGITRPIFKILSFKYDKCRQRKGSRISLLLQYIIVMHFFFLLHLQRRSPVWFKTHWIHRFLCPVPKGTNRTHKHIQVRLLLFSTKK